MGGRGTSTNGTIVGVPSIGGESWNGSADQEAVFGSVNSTWNSRNSSGNEHDFVVMIATASVLCLLILTTVVGEFDTTFNDIINLIYGLCFTVQDQLQVLTSYLNYHIYY